MCSRAEHAMASHSCTSTTQPWATLTAASSALAVDAAHILTVHGGKAVRLVGAAADAGITESR